MYFILFFFFTFFTFLHSLLLILKFLYGSKIYCVFCNVIFKICSIFFLLRNWYVSSFFFILVLYSYYYCYVELQEFTLKKIASIKRLRLYVHALCFPQREGCPTEDAREIKPLFLSHLPLVDNASYLYPPSRFLLLVIILLLKEEQHLSPVVNSTYICRYILHMRFCTDSFLIF